MAAPATLPADFFSRQAAAPEPPATLPPDFFSAPPSQPPSQPADEPGIVRKALGSTVGALGRGIGGVVEGVGGAITALDEMTGAGTGSKGIGPKIAAVGSYLAKPPKWIEEAAQSPDRWTDPAFLSNLLFTGIGSTTASFVPGGAAAGAVGKAQSVARLIPVPILRKAAQVAAGTGVGAFFEALTDAGSSYNEAIEQHKATPEAAAAVFRETLKNETAVTALLSLPEHLMPRAGRAAAKLLWAAANAGLEGVEEVAQGAAQRQAMNTVLGTDIPLGQGMAEEFVGGVLGGGAFSAGRLGVNRYLNSTTAQPGPAAAVPEAAADPAAAPAEGSARDRIQQFAAAATGPFGLSDVTRELELAPSESVPVLREMEKAGLLTREKGRYVSVAPAAPTEAAPASTYEGPRLPADLAKAKPRYNYGSKSFALEFDSDIDRALFIAAQNIPSKRDADFVAFAAKALGIDEATVRKQGQDLRAAVKQMAAGQKGGTAKNPAVLRIGAQVQQPAQPTGADSGEGTAPTPITEPAFQPRAPLGSTTAEIPATLPADFFAAEPAPQPAVREEARKREEATTDSVAEPPAKPEPQKGPEPDFASLSPEEQRAKLIEAGFRPAPPVEKPKPEVDRETAPRAAKVDAFVEHLKKNGFDADMTDAISTRQWVAVAQSAGQRTPSPQTIAQIKAKMREAAPVTPEPAPAPKAEPAPEPKVIELAEPVSKPVEKPVAKPARAPKPKPAPQVKAKAEDPKPEPAAASEPEKPKPSGTDLSMLKEAEVSLLANMSDAPNLRNLTVGQADRFRALKWVDEKGWFTEAGESAIAAAKKARAEEIEGKTFDTYKPGSGTLTPPEESRFAMAKAFPYNGKPWITNGHYAIQTDTPKNWPIVADDSNKTYPNLSRAIPQKRGNPVVPVAWKRGGLASHSNRDDWKRAAEIKRSDKIRIVVFDNGSAIDATYFDAVNKIHKGAKWSATTTAEPVQAHVGENLVAVVMPMTMEAPKAITAPRGNTVITTPGLKTETIAKILEAAKKKKAGDSSSVYLGSGLGSLQAWFDRKPNPLLKVQPRAWLKGAMDNESLKAFADTFVRPLGNVLADEGGGRGRLLVQRKQRATDAGEVLSGKRLVRLVDAKLDSLSDEEAQNLHDALEGIAEPQNARVREAFRVAQNLHVEIESEAYDLGIEVMEKDSTRREFEPASTAFPRIIRPVEEMKSGPVRRDIIANLQRIGEAKDAAEAERLLDDFIAEREIDQKREEPEGANSKLKMVPRHQVKPRRYAPLEIAADDNPFYDPDPRRVLPTHVVMSSVRIEQVREFGQENEVIAKELREIENAGGNVAKAHEAIGRMLHHINRAESDEARISRLLRAAQGFKLGLAAVNNATQGTLNTMLYADLGAVATGFRAMFSTSGRRFAIEAGATIDPILHETVRDLAGSSRLLDKYLRATGFNATERANRVFAANAGAAYAQKLAKRGDKRSREVLAELGLDADAVIARKSLTADEVLLAAKKFSDITQFRGRPEDMPKFASSPLGRVFFQFKSFAYAQSRFVARNTITEARRGNYGRAMRNLLVLGLAFPAAGELVRELRALLSGRERKDLEGLERWADSMAAVGALGVLYDLVEAGDQGRTLEFLTGPTFGEVKKFGDNMLDGDKDAEEKLVRLWKDHVAPRLGPLRRLSE